MVTLTRAASSLKDISTTGICKFRLTKGDQVLGLPTGSG